MSWRETGLTKPFAALLAGKRGVETAAQSTPTEAYKEVNSIKELNPTFNPRTIGTPASRITTEYKVLNRC